MKRFITILLFACVALCAAAQDEMLQKIIAANTFDSVQASFSQVRHSSLMTDDLKSEGKVWLQVPDKVRWEVTAVFKGHRIQRRHSFRQAVQNAFCQGFRRDGA
ncbi:MAG: outer membrane lipoprotein carrier protein LolA [Bacteroidales bacterium]|nr:outer membrane lipoprotein carrier protein LolA [Bacteroidales bacterium]